MRLLQHGYSVNTTIRSRSSKKNISFLTNLPKASEKLHVFHADMDDPDSFGPAIEGCVGVFHVAHPYNDKETEETITNRSVNAMLGILKACLSCKTVRRVIYTSSAAAVMYTEKGPSDVLDEATWSEVDFIRSSNVIGASYSVSKTLTEKAALEFSEKHCLDVVTVIPSLILGPFICDGCPGSVKSSLAMFVEPVQYFENTPFVHIDDVASAHIFLFEHTEAKGRYICSAVETATENLIELISKKHPESQILSTSSSAAAAVKLRSLSSKKLLDAGLRFKHGVEEMFDEAIECCKQKGLLL
ncbi:vestitone reductase [Phtheirospermum japonicum]|uniref:Dihydroflavonol 4-reductase n=1 Tax=Phtheirospermum japonicum TaxID=374723 RepID=A0A830BBV7_9LAMI|nr:vestitone reductase [Phtheirospermum japonicum]